MVTHIVKRRGAEEHYDPQKVYRACLRACLNAHLEKNTAEQICTEIERAITAWINELPREVSSQEIFDTVFNHLQKYNPDAAFMYRTHRDIS